MTSLAVLRERGESLTVYCPNGHGSQIDYDVVIGRLGPDFDFVENRERFLRAFRCRRCGQAGHSLIRAPRTGYDNRKRTT